MNKISQIILEKVAIVDYIKQVLKLEQKGNNWIAICPFHDDHKPSLSISESKKIFKCFSCNVGGNVIDFVMKWEKCDWKSAVQKLNTQFNLQIPFATNQKPLDPAREAQKAILLDAQKWFHLLLQNQANVHASLKAFLKKRQINAKMIENWKLGWVEEQWNLLEFLESKGHKRALVLNSGLFVVTTQNNIYPFFQKRLLFSIYNDENELVGFAGRKITDGDDEIKYLSFPTTKLFRKNELLFNSELASTYNEKHLYLVEGILDAMRIHMQKRAAIALMGTSLSQKQIARITTRYQEVTIWLDNDQAGWEASLKVATLLANTNLSLKIIAQKEKADPDSWILKNTTAELPTGVSLLDWFFQQKIVWSVQNKQTYEEMIKIFWTQSDLNSQEKHRQIIGKIYGLRWLEELDNFKIKTEKGHLKDHFQFQNRPRKLFNLEEAAVWLLFFFADDIYKLFSQKEWKFNDPTLQKHLYLIEKWYNNNEETKSIQALLKFLDNQLAFSSSKGSILLLLKENKAWIKDVNAHFINDLFNKFARQAEEEQQPLLINLSFQEISQLWKEKQKKRQSHEYISPNWKNPFDSIAKKSATDFNRS